MPRKASHETKERIIAAAMYLFWERGYGGTAMADLLKKAGANSGSFYYFFKSKEALLDAVLDRYLELLDDVIVRPVFEKHGDPLDRIFGILAGYRQRVIQTHFTYGCPLGRLALEIDPANDSARQKIGANFRAWIAVIIRCLEDASPLLPGDVDLTEVGYFVLTVMEGAVMQARVFGSIEPFDASVRQLRRYLDRLAMGDNTPADFTLH